MSANINELYATLADIVSRKTTAEWLALLADADIPHSKVPAFEEVVQDPHLRATGMVFEYEHPTEGRLRGIGIPTRFSRTPGNIRTWAQGLPVSDET
ncbi:CoA transferase [Cupriavidus basilensis]